jgi:hypothetical protein
VAPTILNKPDRPDDDELETLRSHPIEGYRIIAPLHRWLGPWAATVRDHHERFDGTGYPNGLRGGAISLGGRIVAVTDSYETMTAGRPYRNALTVSAAREELVHRSGTHFDPYVVRAFLAISLRRLWPLVGFGALLAYVPFLAPVSWRLFRLGSRSWSGVAAAGATTALIVAGLAGPAIGLAVHGPASKRPQVASTGFQPHHLGAPARAAGPTPSTLSSTATSPSSVSPTATPGTSTAATTSASSSGSGGVPSSSGAPPPPPGPRALYPPGIGKHTTLPPGIAKNPNPFAQWRRKH